MNSSRSWLMTLTIFSLLLCGCSSLPRTEYYDLACTAPQTVASNQQVPASVTVDPFTSVQSYSQAAIAYRSNPYRMHYDRYRQWASPPTQLTHKTFTECLRKSNLFRNVSDGTLPGHHKYKIHGRILEFYELNQNGQKYAVLEMELTCSERNNTVIFSLTPRAKVKAQTSENLTDFARAMSEAMKAVFSQFMTEAAEKLPGKADPQP